MHRPTEEYARPMNMDEEFLQVCNLSVRLSRVALNRFDVGVVFAQIICAISAVVNIAAIVVIASTKELQKRQNIFTCSLAFSDGIFALGSLATLLRQEDQSVFCLVMFVITDISVTVSLLTIGFIALERFIVIVWKPFERDKISTKTIVILCIFNWMLSTSVSLPGYIADFTAETYLTKPSLITGVIVILIILYIAIYWRVRQHELKMKAIKCKRKKVNSDRLFVTFSIILGIFALCWLPYCMVMIFDNYMVYNHCDKELTLLYMVGYELILINSLTNPFLYLLRITEFRNASFRLFTCRKRTSF
ncbi:adrenocorticotropic hormone receptor-like [Anneissia japonica]|uniref:adrenocorticotropic hormone receptor-like n=1 Tax=Anneissia japonica TaxID=1529436 RepID=UPI0014255D31|nr:adrenocorticotropic hormone receptor-like [Anneissia japonica]